MKISCYILVLILSLHSLSLAALQPNVRVWGGDNFSHQWDVPANLTNAIAVSAGSAHLLALSPDGTVVAWGDNSSGQCNVPTGLTNAIGICAKSSWSAAITSDGRVALWGNLCPFFDCLTNVPPSATNVIAITGGFAHMLALRPGGDVIAWGWYASWQPIMPTDLTNAVAICAGAEFSGALRADGTISIWGIAAAMHPALRDLALGLTNAVGISAGNDHVLALRADGSLASWGILGPIETPVGLSNVVAISSALDSNLALKKDGTVVAWGDNGQTNVPSDLPFVSQISAGWNIAAAIIEPNHALPPILLLQPNPVSQTVAIGASASFRAQASGFPPLTYQWYFKTNAIPGATNLVLTLPNLQAAQSGSYTVAVSNPAGTTWSNPALLSVLPGLIINMVPAISWTGTPGSNYLVQYVNTVGTSAQWTTLATVTSTNLPQFYFDVSGINQPSRFYRVVPVQ